MVHAKKLPPYQESSKAEVETPVSLYTIPVAREPCLFHDYTSSIVHGVCTNTLLQQTTANQNNHQIIAHVLWHICLCFCCLKERFMQSATLPLRNHLIRTFDNGRLRDLLNHFCGGSALFHSWKTWSQYSSQCQLLPGDTGLIY